jgi:thiol-disulfide isomerase/thioredoxin
MADVGRRQRGLMLVGIAAIAGVLAGTVAVYVRGSGDSNGGAAGCDPSLAAAARIEPLATGEVAAFRVAEAAERFDDLAFSAPDGLPLTLADFSGRAVLLNLWATWCVPCRAEMPALDRLQAELGGDAFEVVAVNVDVRNEARARAFLGEIGVDRLAFYSDPSLGVFNNLKRRGHAFGLPATILIDSEGCAIGFLGGPAAWDSEEAKDLIRAALASGPV